VAGGENKASLQAWLEVTLAKQEASWPDASENVVIGLKPVAHLERASGNCRCRTDH